MKLFFLFFLIGVFSGTAQQKKIDSLLILLRNHPEQDTVRINRLNDLAYLYYAHNSEEGLKVADSAILLAKKLNLPIKLGGAYQTKGHNYSSQGQDTLAMEMYDMAMNIYKELNDSARYARVLFNKGLIHYGRSEYMEATAHYETAYEIFKKKKDSFLMAKMLNGIGINYMLISDFPTSLDRYLTAAKIYEHLGATGSEYGSLLSNIGLLYYRMEKLDLSLEYQNEALAIFRKTENQTLIANGLTNMGNLYDEMKKPENAIENYKEAYDIMERIGNKRGMANALTNTGIAYYSLEEFNKTRSYLERTKTMYEELGDDNNLAVVHNYLGKCQMEVYSVAASRTSLIKAKQNFGLSLSYSEQAGSLMHQAEAWHNIAQVNVKLSDYKEAYLAKERATRLKDSIFSLDKKEEIVRLEEKHQYDQKEAALRLTHEKDQAISQAETERQRTIKRASLMGGGGLLTATLLGLLLYKRRRDALEQKTIAEFNAQVADTELKALRSQMNPHFIFNSLNSINAYIVKNEKAAASDYLVKFAKLMRQTLENSEKKQIPMSKDIELLTTYLDIESKRLDEKFTFEIKIGQDIDPENTLVPPLILQPFIENSIWHGIVPKEGAGHIVIDIRKKGEMIFYALDDNGVGFKNDPGSDMAERASFGMKLTKSRIEIINKRKNGNGNVRLINKEEGVRVEIHLPLELVF